MDEKPKAGTAGGPAHGSMQGTKAPSMGESTGKSASDPVRGPGRGGATTAGASPAGPAPTRFRRSPARWWAHLSADWRLHRQFPAVTLAAIENAVRAAERRHAGEIRFVVEGGLSPAELAQGVSPRQRAIALFAQLHVWDTEHRNGVLIYVLLADRDVEIVADRGVAGGRVPAADWEACCRVMETHFAAGAFEAGALAGIDAVAGVLARFPPDRPDAGDELPNAPVLL